LPAKLCPSARCEGAGQAWGWLPGSTQSPDHQADGDGAGPWSGWEPSQQVMVRIRPHGSSQVRHSPAIDGQARGAEAGLRSGQAAGPRVGVRVEVSGSMARHGQCCDAAGL